MEKCVGGLKYSQSAGASKVLKKSVNTVKKVVSKGNAAVNKAVKGVIGGKLTPQGVVALVCYGIMLVAAAFSPKVAADMALTNASIAAIVTVLISAAFSIYGINCMVTGGCRRLSWLYAAILVVWTVGVVGSTLYAKQQKKPVLLIANGEDNDVEVTDVTDLHPEEQAALHHPDSPAAATAAEVADGTNRIVLTQRDNLYEGYDAQGNEDNAPMPYVEGEHASA